MYKAEALEASPILNRAMLTLLAAVATSGRQGSDLRTACGDLIAHSALLIQADAAGPPLAECFDLAVQAGATAVQLAYVRSTVLNEAPVSVGATLIKNSIVRLCLSSEAIVIVAMTFTSREDVDAIKPMINAAFGQAEEVAADEMAQMTYRNLVTLHGALIFHLTETARPLPRILQFTFAQALPTLIIAQRLYYDPSRADELREENKVVHPAFAPSTGRGLSA